MSADRSPFEDRRRHARSELMATAVVFSARKLHGTYLVQDLSAGGACLLGQLDVTPGSKLSLLLQFPGKTSFSVEAIVIRHDALGPMRERTAVNFTQIPADQEDTIHEAILAALERERARLGATILVIAPHDQSRRALERDLRALGHEAVTVATPLEAIAWLERPGNRIGIVLVDVSSGAPLGLDVLDFLGEHHPRIERVVMGDELRPFRLDLALRSGRAHRVLHKPWDQERLAEAVGPTNAPPSADAD